MTRQRILILGATLSLCSAPAFAGGATYCVNCSTVLSRLSRRVRSWSSW